jgi:hypothetical protein
MGHWERKAATISPRHYDHVDHSLPPLRYLEGTSRLRPGMAVDTTLKFSMLGAHVDLGQAHQSPHTMMWPTIWPFLIRPIKCRYAFSLPTYMTYSSFSQILSYSPRSRPDHRYLYLHSHFQFELSCVPSSIPLDTERIRPFSKRSDTDTSLRLSSARSRSDNRQYIIDK